MAQYINKEKLLAKLKETISEGEYLFSKVPSSAIAGLIQGYKNFVKIVNELDTKEINETESESNNNN